MSANRRRAVKDGNNQEQAKKPSVSSKLSGETSRNTDTNAKMRPGSVADSKCLPTAVNSTGKMTERGFGGLSESCPLTIRQASILSKRKAAAEQQQQLQLELARQQALEAEAAEGESNTKKSRRDNSNPVPHWSEVDKDIFFQGVLTVGRDFHKLHKFCLAKTKIKDASEKNRDQVRHFYYRTVKNLQSIISMDKVSRNEKVNELFAIINWAEFRRRTEGSATFLRQHREKLKQLIYTGETKLKRKGKLFKIRTPACPPLAQLFEKAKEDAAAAATAPGEKKSTSNPPKPAPKLPDHINIELQPRTNAAWQRVSDMSHNPHVRLKRRELHLKEEWDDLPHLHFRPPSFVKLEPFDISSSSSPPQIVYNLDAYLKLNGEESSNCDKKASDDPVKFLKDKLNDITVNIQSDLANGVDDSNKSADDENNHLSKCNEWINQAVDGWTSENSRQLSLSSLYFLYGAPDKVTMEYEWPGLERADEVTHIFTGMINRLISTAQNEFSKPQPVAVEKKKSQKSCEADSDSKSPSTRKRKASTGPANTKPAVKAIRPHPTPSQTPNPTPDPSPEFKKPGVPLQTESRMLADAIALGRQELRPYMRRSATRPLLVQRKILPNTVPTKPSAGLQVNTAATSSVPQSVKTMDVSFITSNLTGSSKRPTQPSTAAVNGDTSTSSNQSFIQSILSTSSPTSTQPQSSTLNDITIKLSEYISAVASNATATNSTSTAESILSIPDLSSISQELSNSVPGDILSQAMSSIKTPVKRRITPTLISSDLDQSRDMFDILAHLSSTPSAQSHRNTNKPPATTTLQGVSNSDKISDSHSISEHSLGSLLSSLNPASDGVHQVLQTNLSKMGIDLSNPPPIHSFRGLIDGSTNSNQTTGSSAIPSQSIGPSVLPSVAVSDTDVNTNAAVVSNNEDSSGQVREAWLTADVSLSDFSLSGLLGDKSPKRGTTTSDGAGGVLTAPLLPSSASNMGDDSRMSFLNKLDVNELGLDTALPNVLLSENSMDYIPKFESLSATLETPRKKT